MKISNHYLALKPFLDQTLFGCGDVDYYFRTMDKLKFTDQFIDIIHIFLIIEKTVIYCFCLNFLNIAKTLVCQKGRTLSK